METPMEIPSDSPFISQASRPRRVAVKFLDDFKRPDKFKLPYEDGAEKAFPKDLRRRWNALAEMFPGITLKRAFFTVPPERIEEMVAAARERNPNYQPPDFFTFFDLDVASLDMAEKLAAQLTAWEIVEYVYVESLPVPLPSEQYINIPNNNISASNPYIGGIDAMYAWTQPGGSGQGIKFIDIEQGWCLTHPDLLIPNSNPPQSKISGPLAGSINYGFHIASNTYRETQHGTGVLGILAANDTGSTWKGIAHQATGMVISPWTDPMPFPQQPSTWSVKNAISAATSQLYPNAGDVILLELQVEVQNFTGDDWPVECEAVNFAAIELATNLGIVVIEAAGNGGCDFDNQLSPFNSNPNQNPYYNKNSGAIIVAAATPLSTFVFGAVAIPGRLPDDDTNFGNRVNCFAWGDRVDTLTVDPATGNPNPLDLYTAVFKDTSAASAIIAGAAIVLQSICEQPAPQGIGRRLTPAEMRTRLSDFTTGTLSANSSAANPNADRIGVMPNLKLIINKLRNP